MIFLLSAGKMMFLFPKNVILFFLRKMKDDLFKNNTWKYDIFFKCSEKIVFPKNRIGIWFFFYHQERWHLFLLKIWYLFYGRKMKDDLSQKMHGNMMFSAYSVKMIFLFHTNMISWTYRKHHGNMMFSVYLVKIVFLFSTNMKLPFYWKKQRWSFPEK